MPCRGHLKLWVYLCVATLLFTSATPDKHTLNVNTICSSDNDKSKPSVTYFVSENKPLHLQFHNGDTRLHPVICTVNFETVTKNSRLCVSLYNAKLDCGSSLKMRDGDVSGKSLTINCDQSPKSVEWCTTKSSLKANLTLSKSTQVALDILLYDIRSKQRKVYMDSIPFCASRLELDSSVITVSGGVAPHRDITGFFASCMLTFDYVGGDKSKTICLVYHPLKEGTDCSSRNDLEYKLVVKEKKQVSKTIYICEERSQIKWCSSSTVLELYLYRSPEKTHSPHPEHFSLQILDLADTKKFLDEPWRWDLSGASSLKYSIRCVISLAIIAVFSLFCPRATINCY